MDEELLSVTYFTRQVYLAADAISLARDQLLFFVVVVFCFVASLLFNIFLPSSKVSVTVRHFVLTAVGVLVVIYTYGVMQSGVLLAIGLICQLLMLYAPGKYMHVLVFVVSIGLLGGTHIYNMVYFYGAYRVDYTGSLMVMVAKISGLAFALHDGKYKKPEELTVAQKGRSLREFPGTLPYLSFLFNFPCVLAMPCAAYQEYESFVTGSTLPKDIQSGKRALRANLVPAFGKALAALVSLAIHIVFAPKISIFHLADEKFVATTTFPYRMVYGSLAAFFVRCKYYFAFVFGDATCNAAGFGYREDKDGNPHWDVATNMRPLVVELATSPKTSIENWNIHIAKWLRWVAYERSPYYPRLAAFGLSAIWHGFYGGYLITLPFASLLGDAALKLRRNVRPHFQGSPAMSHLYDHMTRLGTIFSMAFTCTPLMLLEFWLSYNAWKSLYFYVAIIVIAVILTFPNKKPSPKPSSPSPQPSEKDAVSAKSAKPHSE